MAAVSKRTDVGATAPTSIEDRIKPHITGAAVTAGQALYLNSSGKVTPTLADDITTSKFVGFALETKGTNQAIDVLKEGRINIFSVASIAPGTVLWLSPTVAGGIVDTKPATTGHVPVPVGMVDALTDSVSAPTRVVYVRFDPHFVPVANS